jgi:hypothetical protein
MGRMRKETGERTEEVKKKRRSALSPEARENQMISLAYDFVEERLRNGTATSQEATYFLKLGSTREKLEKKILEEQAEYLVAKREAIESAKRIEDLYSEAIKAVRVYQGVGDDEQDPNL